MKKKGNVIFIFLLVFSCLFGQENHTDLIREQNISLKKTYREIRELNSEIKTLNDRLNNSEKKVNKADQNVTASQEVLSKDKQIYYKLLYENQQQSNKDIISAMYWVMRISVMFLLAILGSQIFFNFKIHKKEVDYIKKEIDEKFLEEKSKLIAQFADTQEKLKYELNGFKKEVENNSNNFIKNKFEEQDKNQDLQEKIRNAEANILEKKLDDNIKRLRSELNLLKF